MEDSIGPGLFETVDGGVHSLPGGGERAGSQYLNLLRVSDSDAGVNDLLSGFLQFSGEMPELRYLAFDEGVSQLLYGSIDDELVRVSRFEYALPKGVEGGLRTIARSSAQFDGEDGVAFAHSEVGTRTGVIKYKPYKLGFSFIVVGIANGCRDAESSV